MIKEHRFQINTVRKTALRGYNTGDLWEIRTNEGTIELELPHNESTEYVIGLCATCGSLEELRGLCLTRTTPTIPQMLMKQLKYMFLVKFHK